MEMEVRKGGSGIWARISSLTAIYTYADYRQIYKWRSSNTRRANVQSPASRAMEDGVGSVGTLGKVRPSATTTHVKNTLISTKRLAPTLVRLLPSDWMRNIKLIL
jgi:hypothetical protein